MKVMQNFLLEVAHANYKFLIATGRPTKISYY